ncbi:MAG: hypothetical protein KI788_17090 [Mameliella sp.]|nr:hypothetical protein [Mameliella sp.]
MSTTLAGTADARLLECASVILRDMKDRLWDRLSVDFGKDHAGRVSVGFPGKMRSTLSSVDDTMQVSFDVRLELVDETDISPISDPVVQAIWKKPCKTQDFKFAFTIEKRRLAILDDFSLVEDLRDRLRGVEERVFDVASNMLVAEAAETVADPRKQRNIVIMDEAGSITAPVEESMPEGFGAW